jgi:3-oxoacyl-[acyl-carrier protein] reductase
MVWTQMGQIEVEYEQQAGETLEQTRQRLASAELVPLSRWAEAGEVADAVLYLASDRASYISGVALPVAGGMAPGL